MNEPHPHPLAQAILARRSWRVFSASGVAPEALAGVERAAAAAPSVLGGRAARLDLIVEPGAVAAMTRATTGGLLGKGNLWLRSAPPAAYGVLVADAERGIRHGDRHLYNVDVGVAGELAVIAAAAAGLGSCWMAAIDMGGISAHLGLGDHERVPAVIALGEPGRKRKGAPLAVGWDWVTRAAVSRRRLSMTDICALDRFGSGRSLPPADLRTLPADGRGALDLMAALRPGSRFAGEAPQAAELGLIFEAMRLAPSADNAQTWRFVLLRAPEAIAGALAAGGVLPPEGGSPGALVVVAAAPFPIKRVHREQPFPLIDHPIALTHGILVAGALGLGWNALFRFDHEAVGREIGAPSSHPVTAMLALDRGSEPAPAEATDWVQLR